MSERDERDSWFTRPGGCWIYFMIFSLCFGDCTAKRRLYRLERDVTEIKKALNIPEEPEKEETE